MLEFEPRFKEAVEIVDRLINACLARDLVANDSASEYLLEVWDDIPIALDINFQSALQILMLEDELE